MRVKANRTFGYKGGFLSGWCEVEDKDVARLVRLKLIEPPVMSEEAANTGSKSAGTPLPEDFPSRKALEAANLTTLEQVGELTKTQLIALDGIGAVSAEKILAALGRSEE